MNSEKLTPEESLLLISKTIEETKERFKENGHLFILWGTLTFVVFLSQYILDYLELYKKFDIIWTCALFPLGGIYTYLYVRKKIKEVDRQANLLSYSLKHIYWIIGLNFMAMGLLFSKELGNADGPVFIILFAIMILVSGLSIKFKPLIISGVIVNLIGLSCFILDRKYYGLGMMLGALIGFVIPGILLNKAYKKDNV